MAISKAELAAFALKRGNEYPYDAPDNWREDDIEEPPPAPRDWAHAAARGILHDLNDRRGIKDGFRDIDAKVRREIVQSLAAIIRAARVDVTDAEAWQSRALAAEEKVTKVERALRVDPESPEF